ncbi:hypothetical protein BX600DRAFT_518203 [Xylariales sp. PMI_506]|nr:hypothetical protein BX600DRAFT_518203 [Xylariales sp. PMI_506]
MRRSMPGNNNRNDESHEGHNIIHGAGNEPKSDHVARADHTAPMPEYEKGAALEGMPGGAGHSQGLAQGPNRGQGKGPLHGGNDKNNNKGCNCPRV